MIHPESFSLPMIRTPKEDQRRAKGTPKEESWWNKGNTQHEKVGIGRGHIYRGLTPTAKVWRPDRAGDCPTLLPHLCPISHTIGKV